MVMVTYKDAEAYATWAGKRLPTEEEWELAARGTDGRIFPWGNQYQEGTCNIMAGKGIRTRPVGSYPAGASPFGCLDMIGNAAEWCEDWYGPYPNATLYEPSGPKHGAARVVRGGSWSDRPERCRAASRDNLPPSVRLKYLGFRVVCPKVPWR